MPSPKPDLRSVRENAWVGDAVLSLFARRWILETTGVADGEMLSRFTSNRFLAAFGDPTAVEARIGELYASGGYEAAAEWIRRELLPVFQRQEANRRRH
jgi:dsRNA-specific ribonuclease